MNKALISISALLLTISACTNSNDGQSSNGANIASTNGKEQTILSDIKVGEEIFLTNCKMCHATTTATSTGNAPALDSVRYHWPDRAKLAKYIRNAKENLNQDEYTTALYEKYKGKLQMPPYPGLSDQELEGVIDYVYNLSK